MCIMQKCSVIYATEPVLEEQWLDLKENPVPHRRMCWPSTKRNKNIHKCHAIMYENATIDLQ